MSVFVFVKDASGSFQYVGNQITNKFLLLNGRENVYFRLDEFPDAFDWFLGDFTPIATKHVPKELLLLYLLIKDS